MPPIRSAIPSALLSYAVSFVAALLLLLWLVPWFPVMPSSVLDPSWRIWAALACERGWANGSDVIFTFGPLGCLATGQYWPSTYWPSVLLWSAIAITIVALLFSPASSRPTLQKLMSLAAVLMLGLTLDTAMMILPLIYVWEAFLERRQRREYHHRHNPVSYVAIALLAALALMKFTLLPVCWMAVGIASVTRAGRLDKNLMTDQVWFFFALACAWLLAGQQWQGLADYLLSSMELLRGYTAAMAWPGQPMPMLLLINLILVALSLFTLWLTWNLSGANQTSLYAWRIFIALFLLILIRHASTRGDEPHLILISVTLSSLALLFWGTPQRLESLLQKLIQHLLPPLLLAASIATTVYLGISAGTNLVGGSIESHVSTSVNLLGLLVRATNPRTVLQKEFEITRIHTRQWLAGLEDTNGRYDILGYDQGMVLGLDVNLWRPRPIAQGYAAFTPWLAQKNLDYLMSKQGPDWILLRVSSIDDHLPTVEDAAIWQWLPQAFDVVKQNASFVHLKRRDQKSVNTVRSASESRATETSEIAVNDWIDLSPDRFPNKTQTLYAAIRFDNTRFDRVIGILWKPSARYIELRYGEDARVRTLRLIPAIASAGFLLSPLILDNAGLVAWLGGTPRPSDRVTSLRIVNGVGQPVPAHLRLSTHPFYTPAEDSSVHRE